MLWGAVHARLRLGGQRLLLLPRRRRRGRGDKLQIMYGVDGERTSPSEMLDAPHRLRGRAAGADRQRRLRPAPARRLGRDPRLGLPAHASRATSLPSGCGRSSRRRSRRRSRTGASPTAGIWEVRGEPQHFTSSKVMCWVAVDRGARLAELREDAGRWRSSGARPPTRSTPTSASTRVDERGVFTQHYDTDALDASVLLMPLVRLPAARRPAHPRDRAGDRGRADRGRAGAALPRRGDRRRARRARRATFTICSFWLVSALAEIGEIDAGPRAVRAAARATPARSASTPRRSTRAPAATSATSRRRSPTSR